MILVCVCCAVLFCGEQDFGVSVWFLWGQSRPRSIPCAPKIQRKLASRLATTITVRSFCVEVSTKERHPMWRGPSMPSISGRHPRLDSNFEGWSTLFPHNFKPLSCCYKPASPDRLPVQDTGAERMSLSWRCHCQFGGKGLSKLWEE